MDANTVKPLNMNILDLLEIKNPSTAVIWQFSMALGWYVQVLGHYYQVVYDDYMNLVDLKQIR